ncbi:MAG: hypothetical protein K8T91_06790 [Planctomycetes bacterium]|nr:hypothetical protein [Planctomycetota bacterium]
MLRFTPTAFAKLLHLRDAGATEVGGFGITAPHDLLLIEDLRLVEQTCTSVSVKFADTAVADYFDEQVDQGRLPEQFARIWIHTHPGNSPVPSRTDEATFARCFGQSDWAVMFILAQGGETYARLRFNVGPGGALEIPVEVDFKGRFQAADPEAWDREYCDNVEVLLAKPPAVVDRRYPWAEPTAFLDDWHEVARFEEDPFHHGGPHEFDS